MTFNEALVKDLHDTTTFFNGTFDGTTVVVVVCCTLALNSAVMLMLLIFTTFRKFQGLYFWALVTASSAIIPYQIGFMIEYFQLTSQLAGLIITTWGWPAMVTGQSLVLYSRLGIVLGKGQARLLRAVKWMVIVDGVVFHVSTTVVVFGAYYVPPGNHWMDAYRYIEKIQMTGFTLQEFIISGLYVWRTLEILRTTNYSRRRTRRTMWQLCMINAMIIVADIALLVVEYQDRHVVEQALKGAVYGMKLKLEFAILSKLVGMTKRNDMTYLGAFEDFDESLDQERSGSSGRSHSTEGMKTVGGRGYEVVVTPERRATAQADCIHGPHSVSVPVVHCTHSISPEIHFEDAGIQYTSDERRRRKTLKEDIYAEVCRDLAS
ncbi:hypothetical protein KC332_g3983 [Hortaea werneckii]|uniref:DUF7703 domain-containing protein n=2 Tax=Hortaea werneckii TaxID=91943 RepID=A0A3M7GJD6_HORWE|nr:hypothetical protein KC358_g3998 [Hortaea werneckii]OTA22821.1 hypothetical protein BTJ68_14827 [Hortaea werneckii EXF-2000]KAI6847755.1 hypothetical protein KC350_g3300 [Hortaea werneckii]KAI6919920.1 hypothetical protein KC341_g16961 [Hortaea werneckii]KAI6943274.1 hypothetical protein KC348_g4302 [Hortaea werneckii]